MALILYLSLSRGPHAPKQRCVPPLVSQGEQALEARPVLQARSALRVLVTGGVPDPRAPGIFGRSLSGGFLLQTRDQGRVEDGALKTVSKRAPTAAELADLR